jgi:fibro-slime domain-containing protein
MKNYLKFLPLLIIPALMVQTSCTDANIDEPPPPKPACKLSGDVVAQGGMADLDVILRDFQVTDYGFEMFDTDLRGSGKCAGSNPDYPNAYATPANRICVSSSNEYVPCSSGGTKLYYGEYGSSCSGKKGYMQGPDMELGCSGYIWQNPVYVTKGMVKNRLDYSKCTGAAKGAAGTIDEAMKGRYCARPSPANEACYGESLDMWFTDGPHTKTVYDALGLQHVSGNIYTAKYNHNVQTNWGYGMDRGFFPLDKYDDDLTYGKQSLKVWCPAPLSVDYSLDAACTAWRRNGGPKEPGAAAATVAQTPSYANLLHNYHFTMAIAAGFEYKDGDDYFIEYIGDEAWIFIDGNLAVDLGGTGSLAPAKISIANLAREEGWENGSMHVINPFYTKRQTDDSGFMIKMPISELALPPIEPPCL